MPRPESASGGPANPAAAICDRRRFFAAGAAGAALLGLRPSGAAATPPATAAPAPVVVGFQGSADAYDALVKLCFNENPYGASKSVLAALKEAFKYANRYGYPDHGITQKIAAYHGVSPDHVLLGAGSTEILGLAARAFLTEGQSILGVAPTFHSVFEFATGVRAKSIQLPLLADYQQDVPGLIAAANKPGANVGFVYLCNPNNPTGMIVPRDQIAALVEGLPKSAPLLIDEAYHDFVDDPDHESAISHVIAGRPVVVARTFSKAYGMAGIRLGYAIAPPNLIAAMSQHAGDMSVSALAKWAGVAALEDRDAYNFVRSETIRFRSEAMYNLKEAGYACIPSGGNFFMVDLKRPAPPVIAAFRDRGILVGRPFPPMTNHLRVTVGELEDMAKFHAAFTEIMATPA